MMKVIKNIALIFMIGALFSQHDRDITDGCDLPDSEELGYLYLTDDGNVLYKSPEAIGGWQFIVEGATVSSASGGDTAENGLFAQSLGSTVLAFSLSGGSIPAGCGTLINLSLSGTASGLVDIIVSDVNGQAISFEYFEENDSVCPEGTVPVYEDYYYLDACVPLEFSALVASSQQAFYFIYNVLIDGENVDSLDWVGTYCGETCVGAEQWDVSECSGGVCSVVALGNDGNDYSEDYCLPGETVTFKIYDSSENIYIDAYPSEDYPWENLGLNQITTLSNSLASGCTDELACNYDSSANIDDGSCEYPEENFDCNGNCIADFDCTGTCGGSAELDECGVCGGSGIPDGECDCDGNVDLGCGCAQIGPSGCDETCGSTLEFDECGVCGGSGIPDGTCDCDGNIEDCAGVCGGIEVDLGCGCGQAGPSGCDETCGSTLEFDACGICGGDGSEDQGCGCFEDGPSGCDNMCGSDLVDDECGVCGGDGSDDQGCGCFEPGPSGCDNTCGSDLVDDECGVCGGDGSDDQGCGCFEPSPSGCDNECGSTLEFDECGVCGGNGSSCDNPVLFDFNQSTLQAAYFITSITLDDIFVEENDWVAAFNGNVCVGARQWDVENCGGGICDLVVMGDDGNTYSDGYCTSDDIITFKIYDASEGLYYDAIPSENIPWQIQGFFFLDNLNV